MHLFAMPHFYGWVKGRDKFLFRDPYSGSLFRCLFPVIPSRLFRVAGYFIPVFRVWVFRVGSVFRVDQANYSGSASYYILFRVLFRVTYYSGYYSVFRVAHTVQSVTKKEAKSPLDFD